MPLTQTQLVSAIAERAELSKADAKRALDALDEVVLLEIGNAQKVRIGGLVQLTPRIKPATKKRQGRNPATGESITIAAKPASVDLRARPLAKAKGALPRCRRRAAGSPPDPRSPHYLAAVGRRRAACDRVAAGSRRRSGIARTSGGRARDGTARRRRAAARPPARGRRAAPASPAGHPTHPSRSARSRRPARRAPRPAPGPPTTCCAVRGGSCSFAGRSRHLRRASACLPGPSLATTPATSGYLLAIPVDTSGLAPVRRRTRPGGTKGRRGFPGHTYTNANAGAGSLLVSSGCATTGHSPEDARP